MPSETGITSILGTEKQINKGIAGGYPSLDENIHVPIDQLTLATDYTDAEIGNFSVIPIGVYIESSIPFLDDTSTFYNLVYVPDTKGILFDTVTERFYFN